MHPRIPAFAFLFLTCALSAQTPAVPGGPGEPPSPAAAPGGGGGSIRLQASDVRDLLAQYEVLTRKRIVFDNAVQGPLNISINTPVSPQEAIKIIETALVINGFSIVPGEGNIVKVFAIGKSPRPYGVPIYSGLDQIPDGSDVVSVLFRLQYADSKELQQMVAQYLQTGSPYSSVVPLPNALLVTENAAVLRGIAQVIREADVPPAQVVSEFIQLERADAKDVIEKLEKIFEKTPGPGGVAPAATAQARPARNGAPPNPDNAPTGLPPGAPSVTIDNSGGAGGGLTEDTIIVGKIKLTADIRTNRIHVITRPANLAFVRRLVHEFDSNIRFGEPMKRPLKFISAADVLDVIVKAITEPGAKPEDTSSTAQTNARTNTNQGNTARTSLAGSSSSSTTGSDTNISEGLSTQPVDTTPKAVTIGSTKIIADPRENTVIVLGNAEVRQKIFRLLDELDVRAPQVMLNTVIGELALNNDLDLGIDALGLISSPTSLGTPSTSGTGGTVTTPGLTNTAATAATAFATHGLSLTSANGLSQFGIATRTLNATVQALESTGRFRVTNRPMIFTSNNKKAIIVSGSEIAVPTQTLSNLVNGSTALNNTAAIQSSVEFKKVALQLEVVPLINSDREVSLDILQKLDSLSGASTNVGGNQIPTIQTRYLRSNISVPNRATIVLGGLITRTVSNSNTGVPVLGRVPLLGYFFKKNSRKMDRSELIILIRPVVTATPGETAENTRVERQRLIVEPDVEATLAAPEAERAPNPVRFRYQDFKDR